MRILKSTLCVLLAILSLIIIPASTSDAGCFCSFDYCLGNAWTTTPGSTIVTTTYGFTSTDKKDNGSCTIAGTTPPTKVCSSSVAGTQVQSATITGNIGAADFGFTGTLNVTLTAVQTCGGTSTISSWCSCCKTRARTKFKNTYMCGTCSCPSLFGIICSSTYCGTLTEYVGVVCDEDDPKCVVPANCTATCPPTG